MTAQANSKQLVTVAGVSVEKLEHRGMPVVTLKMIDEVHGRPDGTARRNFTSNKKQFVEGHDFFAVTEAYEIRSLGLHAPTGINLLTESGYLKLVKTFTDDLAWQVQAQLVDCYFHVKQQASTLPAVPSNLELMKLAMAAIEDADRKAEVAKAQANQASHLAQQAITKVDNLAAALTTRTEDYCTVAGYCRINSISMTSQEMSGMGKRCRKASETKGIQVREMFDPRWGRVGLYHFDVLNEVFTPTM